jgi:hypothetical protein
LRNSSFNDFDINRLIALNRKVTQSFRKVTQKEKQTNFSLE